MTKTKGTLCDSLIPWLFVLVLLAAQGNTKDDELMSNIRQLRHDLMNKYDKYARPVINASTPVPVLAQIAYVSLLELNELEETMVLDADVVMHWKDEHLQWDLDKYKKIEHILFSNSEIWRPDLTLFNGAPVTNNVPWNKTHTIVNYNGKALWNPRASITTRCPMLFAKPMEERLCNITMASYSHYKHELDLKLVPIVNSVEDIYHNDNPIWEIVNITNSLETLTFDTLEYSIATFAIRIKRKHDFVGDAIRGPKTVSILLTLAMFWLPSTSDKKLNLGCLVLLVLSGVTLYLSSTVTSPSLLAATVSPLRIILFTVTSALLIEVVIINLSRLSDIIRPPPTLIRILSGMLGRVIGVCSRLEYKEDGGVVRLPETEEEEISQPTITIEEEWSLFAMALDRIFFIIYATIFIIISYNF